MKFNCLGCKEVFEGKIGDSYCTPCWFMIVERGRIYEG
jgi:hypothetical protein